METRIAIDPGAGGGIAWRSKDGAVSAAKMPDNANELAQLIESMDGEKIAVLEKVHSMPAQGVSSVFSFGENFGIIQGVLAGLRIPYRMETPQSWQKRINGLPSKPSAPESWKALPEAERKKAEKQAASKYKQERKNALKDFAAARYPHLKVTLATADALAMLAVWEDK